MSKKPIARLSKGSLCLALALAGSSLALGQSAPAFAASSEKLSGAALVQRVADEQEIHNLLIRYGQMLDTGISSATRRCSPRMANGAAFSTASGLPSKARRRSRK